MAQIYITGRVFATDTVYGAGHLWARHASPLQERVAAHAPIVLYCRSDAQEIVMTQSTVQIVAGILAVVLIAIVILRRKGKKKGDEDEF